MTRAITNGDDHTEIWPAFLPIKPIMISSPWSFALQTQHHMEHQGTYIVTSLSNSGFPGTIDRQSPELMSQSAMSSSAQGFARQQSSGFIPSAQPSSHYSMGNQGSGPMAPLIVSSSIRGTMDQQSSEFTHHSTTPSFSTQYITPPQSSTELMAPSTSTSSDRGVVEERECIANLLRSPRLINHRNPTIRPVTLL
ncbi:hypothetical protein MPH_12939 [Macrophomina phaseolina MS6]|uniref:Uncharacterized protein n=1 Tax=Macrophomina phaseolina (strain MS6) TaxID=1126212 RepID=K2RAR6_MACPH|nr:hypothetical protein MPH_12939 [Macrophomina phaseolina MS6]